MFIIILLSPFFSYTQGEWNNWYFGDSAAITFNTTPPSTLLNCILPNTNGFPISISDSLGNLLFYSGGPKVYNQNHTLMPNGSGLNLGFGSQIIFSVKQPSTENLFFMFHVYSFLPNSFFGLYYSVIDMNLDGGLGDVVPGLKNIPVPGMSDAMDLLTATRHKNNRDVWIVNKKYFTNQYAAFLVTNSGVSSSIVLSNSLAPVINVQPSNGDLFISPDGKKLICKYNPQNDFAAEFCSFDTQTGIVTPLFNLKLFIGLQQGLISFIGFSPDSKLLYIVGGLYPPSTMLGIFQYDLSILDSTLIMNSQVQVFQNNPSSPTFVFPPLQIGPDWKLYFPATHHDSLHVIHNPNVQGTGCNVQLNAISLEGRVNNRGLPQFLQKYKSYINFTGNCQPDTFHFSSDIWPPADSILWNFGDPASGAANFSTDPSPEHKFSSPDQYSVKLYVRHNDNRTDTSWATINAYPLPAPELGPDTIICQGDLATFEADTCSGCTYQWTDISTGLPAGTGQTLTTGQSGIYAVTVTSGGVCQGSDTVQLIVTQPPSITTNPLSKSICSGESTIIPLTSNVANTEFSWTAQGSSPLVSGFSPGSGNSIDQVLTNSGSSPETVTYWITPAVGNCVGDSVQYIVTVTPGDSVMISIISSGDSVCDGTPVTFSATPNNGGITPTFQWNVNGISQGPNDSIFTYVPLNGENITCVLTSSNTICITNNPATSNAIIMTIIPNLQVSISIVPSANPLCEGESITFTASVNNGGINPHYQWWINTLPVGINDSVYTYTPVSGDQVSCTLTSSEQCTTNNPATSNTITMQVNPFLPVGIIITASENPVCGGMPVKFIATPTNGGSSPSYQWQVNGINVGVDSSNYTYLPIDGDIVSCILTSNEECITGNPATSNSITMLVGEAPDVSFAVCFDTITTINAKPFKLKGGVPLGGTYSGPGVDQITGYFNPAMAGIGVKTITYSYTNVFNCSDNATKTITVISPAPFSCGDSLTDIRDNKKYPTVQIGSQCWLAVNLNHGQQIGGSSAQRDNCLVEKYCYNDLPANCTQYGALYQWDELMCYEDAEEIQGLCPPGWHVPSETDWSQLFATYQGNAFAGSPLLYTGYSGFNVLLAGVEFFNQSHQFVDFASIMWSSTSHGPYKAWSHGLNEYNYSVSYYPSYRANAFSVRCIRE